MALALRESLAELKSSIKPQADRLSSYQTILKGIYSAEEDQSKPEKLGIFIEEMLSGNLGIVAEAPLLSTCVEAIKTFKNAELRVCGGQKALAALGDKASSFKDQHFILRELLANAHIEQEEFTAAAAVLQRLDLELPNITDKFRVDTWIRICRLYLEDDDTTSAEMYLNKAKALIFKVEDAEMKLLFQLCNARILDARRSFPEASQAYYEVSLAATLAEDERHNALAKAIACAALAPAGRPRSRILGKLFNDERSASLGEFGILEKLFLERLISPSEASSFAERLAPHQLALTSDGSTVLKKAMVEHNLLACSRIYKNLGLNELGSLLDLSPEKAEQYAARMFEQERLCGGIDRVERIILFSSPPGRAGSVENYQNKDSKAVNRWNSHVQALWEDVERISAIIQSRPHRIDAY